MVRLLAHREEKASSSKDSSSCTVFGIGWKTAVLSFALFVSVMTVTYNSRSLNAVSPNSGSSILEDLQKALSETTELMWNSTEGFFGDYGYNESYHATKPPTASSIQHQQQQQQQQAAKPTDRKSRVSKHEDLIELTRPTESMTCPNGLKPVKMVSNPEADAGLGRRIPKIIHVTGKTKCLTDAFIHATNLWQFTNHSFYFHDDQAVDALFDRDWPMFPQIKNTMTCMKEAGGAAKADLWRYLAMYEYGGIYTDMDNHPNTLFNATSVRNETDAYFLQEGGGWLSQYFFAVSPKHPMMFLAVHDVMREIHGAHDTGNFYVPRTSGPGATKRAFLNFMGLNGTNIDAVAAKYSQPPPGHYVGIGFGNHSVTVFGSRTTSQDYVLRTAVGGYQKMQGWKQMGITNYQAVNKQPSGKTCVKLLHEHYSALAAADEASLLKEAYRRQRW